VVSRLWTLESPSDVIIDFVEIGERVFIELDVGHRAWLFLVGDSLAGESLATTAFYILSVERYARLASFQPVEGRLQFFLELSEITLISSKCFDAFLWRKID
jgi:hypothetical protein